MRNLLYTSLFVIFSLPSYAQSILKTLSINGVERQYKLYVPASYDGSSKVPLVFCFHGLGDNMDNFEGIGMTYVADTANFLVITPQAAMDPLAGSAWNSGAGVNFGGFEYYPNNTVDDIGFITAMIDTTSASFNIDQRRIYACGFSMGGYMTNRLACELNNRIAAFAPVAATIGAGISCNPGRVLPLVTFHGTSDATVAYDSASFGSSVPQLLNFWSSNNGCSSQDSIQLPDVANDGYTVTKYRYGNCTTGGALEHYKVYGADHTWLGPNDDIFYTIEIWNFFRRFEHPDQSLGIDFNSEMDFQLFPNPIPAGASIQLSLPKNEGYIQIMDLKGRLLTSKLIENNRIVIHPTELSTGLYLLSYTDRLGNRVTRKFFVN